MVHNTSFIIDNDMFEHKRNSMIDDLVDHIYEYGLKRTTLHLAVIIFDKYIALASNDTNNVITIGGTCLAIAAKFEEVVYLDDSSLVSISGCSLPDFLNNEKKILTALDFNVNYDTIFTYIKEWLADHTSTTEEMMFLSYIGSYALLSECYLYFDDVNDLGKHIIEFMIVLKSDIETIVNSVNTNIKYGLLYQIWTMNNVMSNNIERYFQYDNSITFPNFKRPPYIRCRYDLYAIKSIIKKQKISINKITTTFDYSIVKYIDGGTYGHVSEIRFNNNTLAAIKCMQTRKDTGISGIILREIGILANLKHENIVNMYGYYYHKESEKVCIILELMECTLRHKIQLCLSITHQIKLSYVRQILEGLKYLHRMKIMHRDISVTNILVSGDKVKICDFGLARKFMSKDRLSGYTYYVCAGYFRPLELFYKKTEYGPEIDMWSCGCVIGYIFQGRYIFRGSSDKEVKRKIFESLGSPEKSYYTSVVNLPHKGQKQKYPRIGLTQLELSHPAVSKLVYAMLEYDPTKRITAQQALEHLEKIEQ